MDIARAQEFVREHHRGVLISYRADGLAQASPVVAAVDEAGMVVVSSRETAYKVRNLRRDPRVSYCGFTDRFFGDWVQLEGRARIVSLPEAMDGLVDYYRATAGEHPDWDEYRAAMQQQRRVLITIPIGRAGPDRSG